MILVPCKIEETKRGYTDLKAILKDFVEGDADCVEVKNYAHKNAKSCRGCLEDAVKRHYKGRITVIQRKDKIYLAKTIAIK